jgi:hypothetical protein
VPASTGLHVSVMGLDAQPPRLLAILNQTKSIGKIENEEKSYER